jgi:hypothetical protein
MNLAYLHVVINHLPIMGVPVGIGVLALGWWMRSEPVKHAALLVFAALGAATVAVYLAGQGGEDFVEHLPGVSEAAIEAHEEMAGLALAATVGLGLLSLVLFLRYDGLTLLLRRPSMRLRMLPTFAMALVLLVAMADAAILGLTGKLGGRIRHVEFVDGGVAAGLEEDDGGHGRGRGRGGRE